MYLPPIVTICVEVLLGRMYYKHAPYSGGLNYCQNCKPASEDGLKESPKHVRQK
jgi:hypothetical protein